MPVVFLSGAWLAGVLAGLACSLSPVLGLVSIAPAAGAMLFPRVRARLLLAAVCCLVFLAGALYSGPTRDAKPGDLLTYNGSGEVTVEGRVTNDPEQGPRSTRLQLSVSTVVNGVDRRPTSGTALLIIPRYPEYRYGDVLRVTGELQGRPSAGTATSEDSAYWDYLENRDILSTMYYPIVEALTGFEGLRLQEWLYDWRRNLSRALEKVLPEPQAALAQGITLGIRANIPANLKADFSNTGTAHLLAISGVNLTIVAGLLAAAAVRLFGRKNHLHIWLTLIVVWLYTWLTGMGAPVVRAAIMVSFFLVGELFGRQRSGLIALLLAAAVMVGFSPRLFYDASFQLSFAAMAGLVFVFPLLQSAAGTLLDRMPEGRLRTITATVADSFEVSLAAVLATWPLTAHYFGTVSWAGPLATFLAMPVMAIVTETSMLAAAFGLFLQPVGQAIGWFAWLPLTYLIVVVTAFGKVSVASSQIVPMPGLAVVSYYFGLALLLLTRPHLRGLPELLKKAFAAIARLPMKWVLPALGSVSVLVWLAVLTLPDNNLHVSFLDVGQGDAILIQRGTRQILVDGGPDPQPVIVEMSKKMPFWNRTIDAVVLTHPDADHLGGLVEVMKRYRVAHVISTNVTDDSPLFTEWQTQIAARPDILLPASVGQTMSLGRDVMLEVLHPTPTSTRDAVDLNDTSVVVRIAFGEVSFLLTGDLPVDGEDRLVMARATLRSTVLKIGHHGSATSSGNSFIQVVDPSVAIISVGKDNNFGHPSQEVTARLEARIGAENIYRTDERGTVEFVTNGDRLWVKTAR